MKNYRVYMVLLWAVALLPFSAHAVLKIDITQGVREPLPVAIPDFSSSVKPDIARDITRVVEADLERSGLFDSLDPKAFIQAIDTVDTWPRFADWRVIGAQALLTGSLTQLENGKLQIAYRLWDVLDQRQVAGKSYTAEAKHWRRLAHLVADDVYTRLTGESGLFDSRIAYVAESLDPVTNQRIKRLAIMDQDGAVHHYLTRGDRLVLTPRFDPNLQRLIYLSYEGHQPSVHLYDLETGRTRLLGQFPGISFAPRFSPDGQDAIFSISQGGNSDIYRMDLRRGALNRLTRDRAIDTSPSYAPDGKQVVFNSDRGGSQQLYVMERDGSEVRRISCGEGSYATPVWSPRGDWIAFTRMHKGKFYIGIMRPDGTEERLLTESYLDEGPSWAPNGRVLIFSRSTPSRGNKPGTSYLYSVDLTGYHLKRVNTPGQASDPAWSALLPK